MKWLSIACAAALLLLEAAAASAPPSPRQRAIEAVRTNAPAEAIAAFRDLLGDDPEDLAARRDLMWLLWQENDPAACLQEAEALLQRKADDLEALELVARSCHRLDRPEDALAAYRRALQAHPAQPLLRLECARLLESLRDYPGAQAELTTLRSLDPVPPAVFPLQARLDERRGDFASAATHWSLAARAFPEDAAFPVRAAHSLLLSGHESEAIARLQALLQANPHLEAARELLIQHSLLHNQVQDAIRWLAAKPSSQSAADVPTLLRLAGLHQRHRDDPAALAVLDRALALAPDHPEALLLRTEALQRLQRWTESLVPCRQALDLNPAFPAAWLALARGLERTGDPTAALEAVRQARQLDPTSPFLLLREARALASADRTEEARLLLRTWIARHPPGQSEVPVLLYHGLMTSPRDPALASRIHLPLARFVEHLQGLRLAGYETVSLAQLRDWLAHRQELPPRPIVLTFDDGRLDSLTNATPVLAENGFTAVMFVAGVNAARNLPGYASWKELAAVARSDRWELHSHGDLASLNIPVTSDGLTGKFLANRAWLPATQDLESPSAWQDRIQSDYASIRAQLERVSGTLPFAHAWPEGNFGQQAFVNVPSAAPANLALTRQTFSLGFHQGGSGVNPRSRDPILLERLEPDPGWTAADLLQQLAERSPSGLVHRELLRLALQARDATDARHWLEALRQHPTPRAPLAWEEARVAFLEQHYDLAAQAARQLLDTPTQDPGPSRTDLWNFLTAVYRADNQTDRAIQACQASLALDPRQAQPLLDLASLLEFQRDYPRSLATALQLQTLHPDEPRVWPLLGRLCDLLERYPEAVTAWTQAAHAFPLNPDYPFLAQRSRYHAGDQEAALQTLDRRLRENPRDALTRQFLVQCARVRNDLPRALALLQEQAALEPLPSSSLRRQIAALHTQLDQPLEAEAVLRLAVHDDPDDGANRLLLAETLLRSGQPAEALAQFRAVAALNPASPRAWLGLADAATRLERPAEALTAIRQLRTTDPHNRWWLLREAATLYADQQRAASQSLLETALHPAAAPALPVLCYHGLTRDPADPLLSHPIHLPVATFEDHLQALQAAGYTTVTVPEVANWFAARSPLPARPILITFDDGRLDSLRLADPILERLGFRAAMFVNTQHASANLPGYATWEELAAFQRTGRWDLQAHGHLSSSRIPLDPHGRQGLFLVSRQWLAQPARPESLNEWQERIRAEHRHTLQLMEDTLGVRPVAFAWPEGDFGQEGIPGFPDTAARSLEIIREFYPLAFHQDAHGQNLPTDDPRLLKRLEPPPAWTGAQLVRQLQDDNPSARITYELLRQDAWQGRIHRGYQRLAGLRQTQASPARLAAAEALLRTLAGDPGHARILLEVPSVEAAPPPELASLQESIEQRQRPEGRLAFEAWADSDDRQTLRARLAGGFQVAPSTRLDLETSLAEHREQSLERSREAAAQLSLSHRPHVFHRLQATLGGHAYDGPGQDLLSASLRWDASWSDSWRSGLGYDYEPGYTVRSLLEDIRSHRLQADATWDARDDLSLRLAGRFWDYTDDNTRVDATAQIAYEIPWIPRLTGLYRLTVADTRNTSPAYYTPQELVQNQVGAEYLWQPCDRFAGRLRYLIGYGQETARGGQVVHAIHADLHLRKVLGLNLRPSLDYQQTPSYRMFRALLQLDWRF